MRLKERVAWKRNRSRSERGSVGFARYQALWRVFETGKGLHLRYRRHEFFGCHRQFLAMKVLNKSDGLQQTDAGVFFRSPWRWKNHVEERSA